jgi:hypothetical protein
MLPSGRELAPICVTTHNDAEARKDEPLCRDWFRATVTRDRGHMQKDGYTRKRLAKPARPKPIKFIDSCDS